MVLPTPTGTGEQVGVVQTLLGQRVRQGLHHVALPHHLGEVPWAVFSGQHKVGHARILRVAHRPPGRVPRQAAEASSG